MNKQLIWLIINPISGSKDKVQQILQLVDSKLDKQKYVSEIHYTKYAAHATEIAAEAVAKKVAIVVAIGGDGTVNEVGKALISSETAMAIIPKGSGNGLARTLEISMNAERAIETINNPIKKKIDVCFVNEIPFFCTAGIGFDALCAEKFAQSKKRGFWNYVSVGFSEFWNFKPIKCTFAGQDYEIFSLTFANASQFGNNAYIAPAAIIDDGWIDCTIIQPPNVWQSLQLIFKLFTKNIYASELSENYRATQFQVSSEHDFLIHFDGETKQMNVKDLKISILEKSLSVIV